ncbi:hypothetical protein [Roseivirga pacifica]|uniref:hypothetical protein n=1 Tax=Roseivirga pacifica TaxID=1267423 RepID=UPI003BAE833F
MQKQSRVKNIIYSIALVITLLLAILQAPYGYYYSSGPFGFLVLAPYCVTGLLLTLLSYLAIFKDKGWRATSSHRLGFVLIILIGSVTLMTNNSFIEKLDWHLRKNKRNQIVMQVLKGELTPNQEHNSVICKLKTNYFPPISNGGNEIAIHRTKDNNRFTIEFYIDRGFLDHYTAFVYTNANVGENSIELASSSVISPRSIKKIDTNWYKVIY